VILIVSESKVLPHFDDIHNEYHIHYDDDVDYDDDDDDVF